MARSALLTALVVATLGAAAHAQQAPCLVAVQIACATSGSMPVWGTSGSWYGGWLNQTATVRCFGSNESALLGGLAGQGAFSAPTIFQLPISFTDNLACTCINNIPYYPVAAVIYVGCSS